MKFALLGLTVFQLFMGVAIAQEEQIEECDPHYTGACIPVF